MTEREDAAAAPPPPSGTGPSGPVAADRSFGGPLGVPGFARPAVSFAEVAMAAPVPAGSPDLVTASAEQSARPGDRERTERDAPAQWLRHAPQQPLRAR